MRTPRLASAVFEEGPLAARSLSSYQTDRASNTLGRVDRREGLAPLKGSRGRRIVDALGVPGKHLFRFFRVSKSPGALGPGIRNGSPDTCFYYDDVGAGRQSAIASKPCPVRLLPIGPNARSDSSLDST